MQPSDIEQAVQSAVAEHRGRVGSLMPTLHAVQERLGFIPAEAVPSLASALNLSRAEVHGVIEFYHDFRTRPPGRHLIRICRAEACQSMGSVHLEEKIKQRLGIGMGESSPDGVYTLEPVYCLGNCACAPSMQVNEAVHARVTSDRLEAVLDGLEGDS